MRFEPDGSTSRRSVCGLLAAVSLLLFLIAWSPRQIVIRNANDCDNNPKPAGCAGAVTCDVTVSAVPSQATFLGYANGTVVCLTTGSYAFNYLSATSRTGYVTFRSASARGALVDINIDNVRWIDFTEVTFDNTGAVDGCSQHVKLRNFTWKPNTHGLRIDGDTCSGVTNQDILIDHGTFADVQNQIGTEDGRLQLKGAKGVTITNSEFSGNPTDGSVASDGIQSGFSSTNITIGPGNYFHGIYQTASSGPHVDSLQIYNGNGGTNQFPIEIVGNYFYDDTIFIGFYDGNAGGLNIHNNVFDTGGTHNGTSNCEPIQMGGLTNVHIHHNTFKAFTCGTGIGTKSGMSPNAQWIIENNIVDATSLGSSGSGLGDGCGSDCIVRYNLKSNGGTLLRDDGNNITGTAIYTGALSFANWANWLITGVSPGHAAGNDGSDMGTLYYGS